MFHNAIRKLAEGTHIQLIRDGEQERLDRLQRPTSYWRVSALPAKDSKRAPLLSAFINHVKADEKEANAVAEPPA